MPRRDHSLPMISTQKSVKIRTFAGGPAVGRSDVDTVMVTGRFRKRGGTRVDVDMAKLRTEVAASRDHLFGTAGCRPSAMSDAA